MERNELGSNITLRPLPDDLCDASLCVEYKKDEFQFGIVDIVDDHALVVDWDFFLLKPLPIINTLISEWTKCSGGQSPKNTLREGVRLHLGITKFNSRDPIAKEIYDTLVKNRSKSKSTNKKHPKWMSHTTLVQDIVIKHELLVLDPISFNPYPAWMTTSKCGMTHYGVKMPTMDEVREQSYTFTSWEGHKFCKETLEVLSQIARKRLEKGTDDKGKDLAAKKAILDSFNLNLSEKASYKDHADVATKIMWANIPKIMADIHMDIPSMIFEEASSSDKGKDDDSDDEPPDDDDEPPDDDDEPPDDDDEVPLLLLLSLTILCMIMFIMR